MYTVAEPLFVSSFSIYLSPVSCCPGGTRLLCASLHMPGHGLGGAVPPVHFRQPNLAPVRSLPNAVATCHIALKDGSETDWRVGLSLRALWEATLVQSPVFHLGQSSAAHGRDVSAGTVRHWSSSRVLPSTDTQCAARNCTPPPQDTVH
jgi:hypothetical protein